MPMLSIRRSAAIVTTVLLVSLAGGCDDDGEEETFPGILIEHEPRSDAGTHDLADEDVDRVPAGIEFGGESGPSEGAVRVHRVESRDQIPPGPVARARVGDVILENERARFFIAEGDESVSPCPYGGNPVDAQYKRADGVVTPDILGEVCPMLNIGQSLRPSAVQVLQEGGETGVGVVAVTGEVAVLDFLNLEAMAPAEIRPALSRVPFDPGATPPLTMTIYYVLRPGARHLQVVSAIRNDGDEQVDATFGHAVKSGGDGAYYNPLSKRGGFGYRSLGADNLEGDPVAFIGYRGESAAYAYVPDPEPRLSASLPIGGTSVTISGVAVSLLGHNRLPEVLLSTKEEFAHLPGVLHLEPGETATRGHRLYVGDGAMATMLDRIYPGIGVETGTVHGVVEGSGGDRLDEVRVTAVEVDSGRSYNQDVTGLGGEFAMEVPAGSYRIVARGPGRASAQGRRVDIQEGERSRVALELPSAGRLRVNAETPDGESVPARVSVVCVDACPNPPTSAEMDVTTDSLPGGFAAVEPADADGEATLRLQPGRYRISVTRGLEWSIWPKDAPATGGRLVDLSAGQVETMHAEIARVVETGGAISGDFHVHGVRSPDSVVGKVDRVMNFVSDGVEVIVSTDHDVVTDYRPAIAEAEVGDEIVGVPGDEVTTSDLGHFNGFPLPFEAAHRAGGALDWGRGPELNMTPAEIYEWVDGFEGDQVIQMNHPASPSLGTITGLEADVLRGTTHADPDKFRLPFDGRDPATGDTGWWSDEFTAIEVMNGPGIGDFWGIARWWFTMIGRGFSPTGTAVTDTHELYSHLGGSPRSWVFVGEEGDTPGTFEREGFVDAINGGRLVGSNGPFFRFSLQNDEGETAGLGEVLSVSEGEATASVTVDVPAWMQVDRVDLFSNVEGVVTDPGEVVDDPLAPTVSESIELTDGDREVAASGRRKHRHYSKTVEVSVPVEADAYVVAVVRAEASSSDMWPVVPNRGVRPFAFSNPIYVDADGGGYDNPYLEDEAQSAPGPGDLVAPEGDHDHEHPHPDGDSLSEEELKKLIEAMTRH